MAMTIFCYLIESFILINKISVLLSIERTKETLISRPIDYTYVVYVMFVKLTFFCPGHREGSMRRKTQKKSISK